MLNGIWQQYIHDWTNHTIIDHIIQVISIVAILFMGMTAIKILGKKSISQMTLTDALFILILSSTLGALITKPNRIFVGALVVITIILFVLILEKIQLKSNAVERVLIGVPEIVFQDGQFNEKALKRNNLSVDMIESIVRLNGLPSIDICKRIVLEPTGNIATEVLPEYEPIKKIYFDAAMQQIMQAINNSNYREIKVPEINNVFDEVEGGKDSHKKAVPKHLE